MTESPRLEPLLTQLDTSLEMALARMDGLTDDEYWWLPEPAASTVERDESGGLRVKPLPDDSPRTRTIILLTGHLGDMALLRTDYTTGGHNLTTEDIAWPDTADTAIEFLRDSWADWRGALATLRDDELDVVGRCDYPDGLDPTLPVLESRAPLSLVIRKLNRRRCHHRPHRDSARTE